MEILSKDKYNEFDEFSNNHINGSFMQTSAWAKLKDLWEHEVVVCRDENQNIIAATLLLIKRIPLFNCSLVYAPRGPVVDYENKELIKKLLIGIKEVCKKYNAYLFKMDPFVLNYDEKTINLFSSLDFSFTKDMPDFKTIQTRHNYMLDLRNRTEDEIFESFHKKWRYNIRVALKHNVTCGYYSKEHLDDFYEIYKQTAKRDGFTPRSKQYFEKFMDCLGEKVRLYICYYNDKAVSGAITTQFSKKTCYVYGASDSNYRNVMPNHLMQWEMIKWAKQNDCVVYDFQGIPVDMSGNSTMHGVYTFKKGFNGECVMFFGEFDLVLKPFVKLFIDNSLKVYSKLNKFLNR